MSYVSFNSSDFVVSADSITSTLWSGEQPILNQFFTSSISSSFNFFLNVYQTSSLRSDAEVQFAIAYGNSTGGGGVLFDANVANVTSTRVIYGQYRTLLLEDENAQFVFGSSFNVF